MDLKEIFKHEEGQLYPTIAKLDQRFHKLRDLFKQFVGHFPPGPGAFPTSVEFEPEPDKPLLTVRWCGKELRFRFDMKNRAGRVRCLVSLPDEADEEEGDWEELGSFTFDGEAKTDITPPGPHDADPLMLNEAAVAYAVVGSFLVAAV